MSSILKALQRIEENQGRTPTSAPREPQPPRRSRLRLRTLLAALSLGGLVGLVAAFWWLPGYGPEPEVAEAPPTPRASLARPRPAPPPAPPIVEAAPVPEPTPEPKPLAPPPKPVAKPEPKPAPRPAPPPKPAAKPAPKPAPVPAPAGPAVARVEKLPALVVTRTEWHPDPARRRALIRVEGRAKPLELRHGDAVGALVVATIEPSGVVFRMGEVEVRRKIGEPAPGPSGSN